MMYAFIIQWTFRKVYERSGISRCGPRGQKGPGMPVMQLVRGT